VEVAQGRVGDRPFARTIYAIAAQRFTGDLLLRDGDRRYKLSWEDGRVVAAESAAPADGAARVALSAGLITSTDVSRALDAMARSPGADPLEVLIEVGRLRPDQVIALKRRLLAQRAARAFALPDAIYLLDNARSLRADPDVPPLDARWLVYFGLRTHYTAERLTREMGALLDRGLRLADDATVALPAFAFGDAERPVMDRLSLRAWTPRQLIDACAGMDGRQILSVVYALLACDCLEQGVVTPETSPPPIANAPSARGTETRPPTEPNRDDASARRGRVGTSSAPAVPGAAEHARLAHGTVRRLLFPGQGTGSPPVGDVATARARRASTRPPPNPTTLPADQETRRTGTDLPRASDPRASGQRATTEPPVRASTQPPRAPTEPPFGRRPSEPPPFGRTPTEPPPFGRAPTDPPYGRAPTDPPYGRAPTQPPSRKTSTLPPPSVPTRSGRDTAPPPISGTPRPHSTTVPPMLRRSHSTTGSIPVDALRGAAAETRKMIVDKVEALDRGADHYAILGVSQLSKADEVRTAYFAIAKRIHPDRLRAVGVTDMAAEAQRLFARINQAFGVLSDPQRRAEYSVMLSAGGEDAVRRAQADAEEKAGRVLRAEETFRRGEMALRRSQFELARVLFLEAVELNGDEAEYHALLAWATWLASPDKQGIAVDVQKRLAQALALSPQCVPAHFYGGQVAKQSGQMEAALDAFRTVIDIEPGHAEANLELRVLRGRMKKR
jgi:DnaJ-domain-containing protein 1